jgi:hypothetical protein
MEIAKSPVPFMETDIYTRMIAPGQGGDVKPFRRP